MDKNIIINELKNHKPLKNAIQEVRYVSRSLLDRYFSEVPYTKNRRIWELSFFGADIAFIEKKWVLEIIWELETYKGSNFNELKRGIRGISSRILSDRLKELEKNEIISRTVQDTHPPKVLYSLTEKGKGFVELMVILILFLKKI